MASRCGNEPGKKGFRSEKRDNRLSLQVFAVPVNMRFATGMLRAKGKDCTLQVSKRRQSVPVDGFGVEYELAALP